MSVTPTFLTVTPTWSSKRLTLEGSVAVREAVALTVVGCGTDTSIVFKLSSENGRVDYAKFPNAVGDAWTVSGSDLTGTLSLNTDLLVAAFASLGPEDTIDLICTVASAAESNLHALGHVTIKNWMENTDDPVAYSTPLADAVSDLETAFDEHTHNGTDAPKVTHANLIGIGVNTHEQIDAALASLAASVVTLDSGQATQDSNIAANATAIRILNGTEPGQDATLGAVKHADFSAIDPITLSTATVKKLATLINQILAAAKG